MSVTFAPTSDLNLPHSVTCYCTTVSTHNTYYEAYTALKASTVICYDPYCTLFVAPTAVEPEVQISNHNASVLFDILGIEGDTFEDRCCGTLDGEDFLNRVILAEIITPTSTEIPTLTHDNIIYGGRPEGYYNNKLAQLRQTAEFAAQNGRQISWG
jgi:hypothetical protein